MLETGKKIGGRYKIIKLIGTGGMANVYLGNDLILDRDVAIKVLRFDFRNNPEALRRFQREALSATQLIHPNIVSVYDVDEEDGLQYIVMEYVRGTDLKKYIEQHGRVSPEDSIFIMNQVLSAMALAHRNRIIHRDIKPQNILIDQDKHVKVTDFGIAVALSDTSITQTNTLLGSVHYLSPEQARGSMATIKSDIYALGIVLYELLSGEVPFDGESAVSIALKHFQEAMPSIRKKYPELPQSLENAILKATAKEPADRYDSCEEMMEDLETALDPSRVNEPVFSPGAMLDKTKVIQPIKPAAPQEQADQPDSDNHDDTMKVVPAKVNPKNGERKPENKKKKKKRLRIFLPLLFILLAAFALFFIWKNREPETVLIPEIENVSENTARRMLEEANLTVADIQEEYHDDIAEEFVIRTSPAAGEAVPPQSSVDLVVSLGKEPIVMESYLGKNYSEVRDQLREKGFIVDREDEFDDEAEAGVIIQQSISEGTELVPDGRTITLTVSMGAEVFTMTNLEGYTKVSVQDYAEQYGLKVDFEEENSDDVAEGLVLSQSISPQSNFSRGDSLLVTLSSGPAQPEYKVFSKKIVIPFEAPDNKGNAGSESSSDESKEQDGKPNDTSTQAGNHVVIHMEDADHHIDDIFREFNMSSDQEITLNFRILEGETGAYRVLRDGKKIMEETNLTE